MRYCTKCPDAVARITGGPEAPQLSGCIEFYQENSCVLVVARISGLPKKNETGFYGFHIHQGNACPVLTFLEQAVTTTRQSRHIRNMPVTCRHYCAATETPICL